MKKILLFLLLAWMGMLLHAEEFTQGDFVYTTTSEANVVTLKGLSSSGANKTSLTIPGYTFNASTLHQLQ